MQIERAQAAPSELDWKNTDMRSPGTAGVDRDGAVAHMLAGLAGVSLPGIRTPASYRIAVGALAVALTVMAGTFVALLCFLLWLLFFHIYQAASTLWMGPYFVFHVPMAILGAILLALLVKPWSFQTRYRQDAMLALSEADETELFAFVRRLCQITGAPVPTTIEVDCEANASARRAGGWVNRLLRRRRFILRIGLPLVAALPADQLAAVVAHELGHFNQYGAMTGANLIRRLIAIFVQIVFQRDRLDVRLDRLRHGSNVAGKAVYWLIAGPLEAMRGVLWLMLILAELLCFSTMRRMEHNADHVAAELSGSATFVKMNHAISLVSLAWQQATAELTSAFEQGRLADDLPALIVAISHCRSERNQELLKTVQEQSTRWFSTHPSDADRAANVMLLAAAGQFHCEQPSTCLFKDFGKLSARATKALYKVVLGSHLFYAKLIPVETLTKATSERDAGYEALKRFFGTAVVASRPIFPAAAARVAPQDADAAARTIERLRQTMVGASHDAGNAGETFEKAAAALGVARAQLLVCAVPDVRGSKKIRAAATKTIAEEEVRQQAALATLAPFEAAAAERLTLALQLLRSEPFASRALGEEPAADENSPSAGAAGNAVAESRKAQLEEMDRLLTLGAALQAESPEIFKLRDLVASMRALNEAIHADPSYRPLAHRLMDVSGQAMKAMRDLRTRLGAFPYPFDHAMVGIPAGAAVVRAVPKTPGDTHFVFEAAISALDGYYNLTFRVLSRLTVWAARTEAALGMAPLHDMSSLEAIAKNRRDEREQEHKRDAARNTRRFWLSFGGRAVGGAALLTALALLSIFPPTLPAMHWGDDEGPEILAYRPAAFYPSVMTSSHDTDNRPATTSSGSPGVASSRGPQVMHLDTEGWVPASPEAKPASWEDEKHRNEILLDSLGKTDPDRPIKPELFQPPDDDARPRRR